MDNVHQDHFKPEHCPILKAVGQIGDRWILLILRELFQGRKKFEELHDRLNVSKSVLTNKLSLMLNRDLIEKVPYKKPGERTRNAYKLTQKGKDLRNVLIGLLEWGNQYLIDDQEVTLYVINESSKKRIGTTLADEDGNAVNLHDIRMVVDEV